MNQFLIPFDTDPLETREWRESLQTVMQAGGRPRAHYLIDQLSGLDTQQHDNLHTRAWTAGRPGRRAPPERDDPLERDGHGAACWMQDAMGRYGIDTGKRDPAPV